MFKCEEVAEFLEYIIYPGNEGKIGEIIHVVAKIGTNETRSS